jgi:hypothetical protein
MLENKKGEHFEIYSNPINNICYDDRISNG